MMNQNSDNSDIFANAAGLFSTNAFINSVSTKPWILDSGVTDHISSKPNFLTHTTLPTISLVNLPTGSTAPITVAGNVNFNKNITLKNVLCVPSFHLNLMSANRLTNTFNCCVILLPNGCIIQDLATGRTIGSGEQHGSLYYVSPVQNIPISFQASNSTDLWHKRLGHPSSLRFKLASSLLPSVVIFYHNNCNVCPKAKQTRLSFPISEIKTHSSFELLHCDIWGPHKIPTQTGHRFFLIVVDNFSRCTWIFLMTQKSQTTHLLESFITFAQNQFHTTIKIVCTDNGLEFLSVQTFFHRNGIEFQSTCTYTPQQNEVVERKHRHILNTARALLFQSHMPLEFWGECALTAVHIINRLPSSLLKNKSPFELLYHRPPSLSHLRVFGCLSYATVVHPKHKFDS